MIVILNEVKDPPKWMGILCFARNDTTGLFIGQAGRINSAPHTLSLLRHCRIMTGEGAGAHYRIVSDAISIISNIQLVTCQKRNGLRS